MSDLLKKAFDFVKVIAEKISEACTGPEAGTNFIMIIFYLVLLILTLVLLKLLFKVLRGFFPSKKKPAIQSSAKTSVTVAPEVVARPLSEHEKGLLALKGFDKQKHLDQLSISFKKLEVSEKTNEKPQRISFVNKEQPSFVPMDNISLSALEKENVKAEFFGKGLSELKCLFVSTKECERKSKNKVEFLNNKLSKAYSSREKFGQELSSAVDNHNQSVDKVVAIQAELERNATALSSEYSKILTSLTDIDNNREEVLYILEKIEKNISSILNKITNFDSSCDDRIVIVKEKLEKEMDALNSLKDCYLTISKALSKTDEEIESTRKDLESAIKEQALNEERLEILDKEVSELTKIENERLAKLEAERIAREEEIRAQAEESRKKAEQERRKVEEEKLKAEKERIEREKQAAFAKSKEDKADEKALNEIKNRIKKQAESSYSLNIDSLSPEQLDQMARAELKRKKELAKVGKGSDNLSEPDDTSINTPDSNTENSDETDSNAGSNNNSEVEEANHFEMLQQVWAAEREHKDAWEAEKKQREMDALRRKEQLLRETNKQDQSNND